MKNRERPGQSPGRVGKKDGTSSIPGFSRVVEKGRNTDPGRQRVMKQTRGSSSSSISEFAEHADASLSH